MVKKYLNLAKILFLIFISIWNTDLYAQTTEIDSTALLRHQNDSLMIRELTMQIQELKLNAIVLENEKKSKGIADSIKKKYKKDK